MISILKELEMENQDIKNILSMDIDFDSFDINDVKGNIELLKLFGFSLKEIRNIVIANPMFLNNMTKDTLDLLNYLKEELNITYLNLLFDSNPFLLLKEKFEIKEFVSKKEKEGLIKEDIKDLIESNPYVIDEV